MRNIIEGFDRFTEKLGEKLNRAMPDSSVKKRLEQIEQEMLEVNQAMVITAGSPGLIQENAPDYSGQSFEMSPDHSNAVMYSGNHQDNLAKLAKLKAEKQRLMNPKAKNK
jgi:hypothetical protein